MRGLLALALVLLGIPLLASGCGEGPQPEPEPLARSCVPEQPAVVPGEGLAAEGDCPFSEGPCNDDYLAFPQLASEWAAPLTDEEFEQLDYQLFAQKLPLVQGELSEEELRAALVEALEIDFLVDGLHERELRASEGPVQPLDEFYPLAWPEADAEVWSFQLEDPYVGTLRGIVAKPEGDGPFPTVVGVHGHHEEDHVWIAEREASMLLGAGLAFVAPTMRVNNSDEFEGEVTEALLRQGFTFAGLRTYEHLLTLRYAASLGAVDRCRVGLIGHSGGAITGNVTVRVAEGLSAYVSDLTSNYAVVLPDGEGWMDETAPGLFRLQEQINDFETSPVPILELDYNFELPQEDDVPISQWPEIEDFYLGHLLGPPEQD